MTRTAVIAGVGPGLGESIARKFAREGLAVGLLARSGAYLEGVADELRETGVDAVAVPTDISKDDQVERAFATIRDELGPVDVLINHASGGAWKGLEEITPDEFNQAMKVGPYGGLLCSKEAAADMRIRNSGTIIFTGATSSIRGREGSLGFSAAKFAVRGMAQSLARELGPAGITVAHVVIDGQIRTPSAANATDRDPDTFLDPDDMAETYWQLVEDDTTTMNFEVHVTNGTGGATEFI